jgi:outer membrane protein assembly factor BamB
MPAEPARLLLIAAALTGASAADAADWMQFGYDAAHTGFNAAETRLGAANVAALTLRYNTDMPATIDSAPVYLSNVATASGTKNLLFALAKNGRLMAIDAATGSEIWHATTSGTQPTTASPAIDPGRLYVYSYGLDGKAHKYAVGDGAEITSGGWPATITLKTNVEKGASGFTIAHSHGNDWLYVVTDGYIGDGGDYQGHVTTINLATGAEVVFNSLCSNLETHLGVGDCPTHRSGIWGRGGAVYDAGTDRIYVTTGNGAFDANTGGFDWGDSVLALAHDGTGAGGGKPRDSYTPSNFQHLDDADIDLGSVAIAIMLAPAGSAVAHVGVQAGKDGELRVVDLDDMSGQGGPGHVGGEVQLLDVPQGGNGYPGDLMREQPAVWVNPSDGAAWLFAGNGSGISGLKLGLDANHRPMLTAMWTKTGASNRSSSPVVANGVLYNAGTCSGGTCVTARDPLTGDVLWTSAHVGGLHWNSPIVVDGTVYLMDNDGTLWAFALPDLPDPIFKNGFDG